MITYDEFKDICEDHGMTIAEDRIMPMACYNGIFPISYYSINKICIAESIDNLVYITDMGKIMFFPVRDDVKLETPEELREYAMNFVKKHAKLKKQARIKNIEEL